MPHNNLLIAIEGIDGAGKTTQVERLLASAPLKRSVKFPVYDSPSGKLIQRILKGTSQMCSFYPGAGPGYDSSADAMALQALMVCNRYEAMPRIVNMLKEGDVILDRYTMSAFAYGRADGLDLKWLTDIHHGLLVPDVQILLDISVETSFSRRPERTDAYEANKERLGQVVQGYRDLWAYHGSGAPSWRGNPVRWYTLAAELGTPGDVGLAVDTAISMSRARLFG